MKLVWIVSLAIVTLAATSARAELAAGREAYARGEFAVAWRELEPVAREGSAEAQYLIGRMLARGEGRAANPGRAAEWYRRAAERGSAEAQNNLGLLYEAGTGVARDASVAAKWYRRAAKSGFAVAAFNLARLLESGVEGTDGTAEAERWYRRSAARGHAGAAEWVSRQGRPSGAESSVAEPVPTAEPSIVATDESATNASVPAAPASARAHRDAWERGDWSEASAALTEKAATGDADAAYRLGLLADQGLGKTRDLGAAERWFRTAAERDHGRAMYELGFLELRGRSAARKKDALAARVWFALAAERQVGDAAKWVERIDESLTSDEIETAEARVRAWRPSAANDDD